MPKGKNELLTKMKISDIEGIVLKSFKYQNSSLIGDIYTPEYGLKTYIAKGLSSKKNTYKRIVFRPPQIVTFTAYMKEHRDIHMLSDIDAAHMYKSLQRNIKKGTIALFYVEVFRKVVYQDVVNPVLYDYFKNTLINLDENPIRPIDLIAYLRDLSNLIGIAISAPEGINAFYFNLLEVEFLQDHPHHSYCLNEADTGLLIRFLKDHNLSANYSSAERRRLFNIYLTYFELQVSNFKKLKSPEIISEVLLSS